MKFFPKRLKSSPSLYQVGMYIPCEGIVKLGLNFITAVNTLFPEWIFTYNTVGYLLSIYNKHFLRKMSVFQYLIEET